MHEFVGVGTMKKGRTVRRMDLWFRRPTVGQDSLISKFKQLLG